MGLPLDRLACSIGLSPCLFLSIAFCWSVSKSVLLQHHADFVIVMEYSLR